MVTFTVEILNGKLHVLCSVGLARATAELKFFVITAGIKKYKSKI